MRYDKVSVCLVETPESLQTEFSEVTHMAEEQVLKDRLTWNERKSGRCRVDTRRTVMSKEDGQNLETPINVNNKN
jgi:hypothetical protein